MQEEEEHQGLVLKDPGEEKQDEDAVREVRQGGEGSLVQQGPASRVGAPCMWEQPVQAGCT